VRSQHFRRHKGEECHAVERRAKLPFMQYSREWIGKHEERFSVDFRFVTVIQTEAAEMIFQRSPTELWISTLDVCEDTQHVQERQTDPKRQVARPGV
jgi:hypothetical protein